MDGAEFRSRYERQRLTISTTSGELTSLGAIVVFTSVWMAGFLRSLPRGVLDRPFMAWRRLHFCPRYQNASLRQVNADHWNTRFGILTRLRLPSEWHRLLAETPLPGASHMLWQCAKRSPQFA